MSGSLRVAILLAVALVALGGVGYAGADSTYDIRVSNSIDVPDRTYSFQGTDYTVTSVGRVSAGDVLTAKTDGPEGTDFDVNLYNSNRQIVDVESGGDGSVSFQTDLLSPGTYVLVVYTQDGSLKTPQSVIVTGYETTLDTPSEIAADESAKVTAELTDTADLDDPERVELVIVQDETTVRTVSMAQEGTYEYATDVGSSLDPGEYDMYVKVRNETMMNGEHEVVGLSDRASLTVSTTESDSTTPAGETDQTSAAGQSNNGDSNGGSDSSANNETGGDATTTGASTATVASETKTTVSPSATARPNSASPMEATANAVSASETITESESSTTGSTEATVTTDGSDAETRTDTTMPNGALSLVAFALVVAAILARH